MYPFASVSVSVSASVNTPLVAVTELYSIDVNQRFYFQIKNFWHLRLFIITAFTIVMKDEGAKVLKLVKTNFASDFLKDNTSVASVSGGIIFVQNARHRVLTTTKRTC